MKKFLISVLILFATMTAFAQNDTILPKLKKYDNYAVYIQNQIKYPTIALENGWTGRVEFEFIISHKGCIDSVKVLSSPNINFTKEVIRVLEKTKCKWVPMSVNGYPVAARINSFVDFNLDKKD